MLERWSNTPNLRQLHGQALENKINPIICLGATAIGLDIHSDTGQVDGLEVLTIDRNRKTVHARAYVLACGGLETMRFLLNQQVEYPRLLAGDDGPLGRFYMGHLPGKIADIILEADRK